MIKTTEGVATERAEANPITEVVMVIKTTGMITGVTAMTTSNFYPWAKKTFSRMQQDNNYVGRSEYDDYERQDNRGQQQQQQQQGQRQVGGGNSRGTHNSRGNQNSKGGLKKQR
jgi:hypothetical protein